MFSQAPPPSLRDPPSPFGSSFRTLRIAIRFTFDCASIMVRFKLLSQIELLNRLSLMQNGVETQHGVLVCHLSQYARTGTSTISPVPIRLVSLRLRTLNF